MEKIVKAGLRDCTVNLDGSECAVRFDSCFRSFAVRNDSAGDVFISKTAGIVPDDDGVMSVKAGASTVYAHMDIYADTVYLLGQGKVQIHAQNDTVNPFNYAPAMDGGEERGGSSYTIENAVDYPLLGLNLYGKSTQDGTPTPENPVEIVSVGDSGSVSVQACGRNLFEGSQDFSGEWVNADAWYTSNEKYNGLTVKYRTYSWSGIGQEFELDINTPYTVSFYAKTNKGQTLNGLLATNPNGVTYNTFNKVFTATEEWERYTQTFICKERGDVFLRVGADASVTKPLYVCGFKLEIGDTATEYEPYNGATANITSAMPLCGIPVESGGNYTDSNGQQWVCDTLVYRADGSGKIVKRTAKIDSYNGETITTPYISTMGGLTTGATIIYQIAEPQEIELTAAEMSALMSLQTFDGITNISNDGGAEMTVGYCTNKMLSEYVVPITTGLQKQIDELKSAVLSLGGNI